MTIHLPDGSTKTVLPQVDEDLISYMDNPSPKTMKLRKTELRTARWAKDSASNRQSPHAFTRASLARGSVPKRVSRLSDTRP